MTVNYTSAFSSWRDENKLKLTDQRSLFKLLYTNLYDPVSDQGSVADSRFRTNCYFVAFASFQRY